VPNKIKCNLKKSSYLHKNIPIRIPGLAPDRKVDPELNGSDELRRLKLLVRYFAIFRHSAMAKLFAFNQMSQRLQRHACLL
jgi:hypothetical protein